jgi:leucyl aminopeptidase
MLPKPMEIKVTVRPAVPADADGVAVLLAKGQPPPAGLPERVSTAVAALVDAGVVTGKAGEGVVHLIEGHKPARLLVVGLGEIGKPTADAHRNAGAQLARVAKQHKLKSVAVLAAADPAAVAAGFLLGRFAFAEYKGSATDKDERLAPVKLALVGPADVAAVDRAVGLAEAQNFARTIATRPGNDVNPPSLAVLASEMADEVGLSCRVLDDRALAKLGMGGILAVGAGSSLTPPRLIVLEHGGPAAKGKKQGKGKGKGGETPPLLVVGKAITFDTGGVSIKPALNMQSMVFDKCGGMAVLGLMYALAKLKVPRRVVGILAAAENHISGSAYRPGDILRMYNGVTVEVTNTDAEGRLVLGDALAWGIETYKPSAVVDLATLTGACVVALGTTMAGLMSNSDALVDQLQRAAAAAGEKVWRLPVDDDHRERLKSVPADIVNAPGREGGALTAAAFLSHFVPSDGSVPWAHLDIAGVADTEKQTPLYGKGATGWGVRTLFEWVTNQSNGNAEAEQRTPPPAGG